MELLWIFDHRFYRDSQGVVFSPLHYNYPFFADRYLQDFSSMKILARIEDNLSVEREGRVAEGDHVGIISLGNWLGLSGFPKKIPSIIATMNQQLDRASAVIIITPGVLGSVAHRIAMRKRRPYCLEVVGDPYDAFAPGSIKHPLRPLLRQWLSHDLRRQCSHAAACHYVTARSLQRRYPPAPSSYATSFTDAPMHEDAYALTPRSAPAEKTRYSLIFVGTLTQMYKGPDILIKALAQCVHSGLDLNLSILGDGRYRPDMERLALDLAVQDRVHFYGMLPAGESVRAHLDRADLFVLPSRTEGLPRALIEAMARALPCIGSAVGGIPELLAPEDLFPPDDVDMLANKIIEVLSSPQRWAQMSERNWRTSREYHEDIVVGRRAEFCRQVRRVTEQWLEQRRQ